MVRSNKTGAMSNRRQATATTVSTLAVTDIILRATSVPTANWSVGNGALGD